ncbi:MAG: hypothetical protein K0V04_22240 [Deltaproteobacteria bacterium]|nr:hypothetical protein [Deltaproteobacteria bacterium]
MLATYLTCLVVGGVFVGLSSLGAIGKDVDLDADADIDVDADVDADADIDVDHDLSGVTALSVGDASQALAPHNPTRRGPFIPMLSFRFWTFGSAFFGLAGTLLSTLTPAGPVMVAALSAGTGIGVGTFSAWTVRWLRRPVGESVRIRDYTGQIGELTMALREGGVSRIRLQVAERERLMLAVATEPLALPAGTRVVVLGIDEHGKALIAPETTIYGSED